MAGASRLVRADCLDGPLYPSEGSVAKFGCHTRNPEAQVPIVESSRQRELTAGCFIRSACYLNIKKRPAVVQLPRLNRCAEDSNDAMKQERRGHVYRVCCGNLGNDQVVDSWSSTASVLVR